MKKIRVILVLLSVMILSACNKTVDKNSDSNELTMEPYPCEVKSNEKIVYNMYQQRLECYDINEKKSKRVDRGNWFQYSFSQLCNIYSSGNSNINRFELIELKDGKLERIFELNKEDSIFPLCLDEDLQYYVLYDNDENGNEIYQNRCICRIENGQLKKYDNRNIKGTIVEGVIYKDEFIFSAIDFNTGEINLYSLFKDELESEPKLIKSNVKGTNLILCGNDIIYEGEDKFMYLSNNKETSISSRTDIYLSENKEYIFNFYVADERIQLDIYDSNTLQKLYSENDVVSVETKEDSVIIYGDGFIKEKVFKK